MVTTLVLCVIFLPMIWYLLQVERTPQSKLDVDANISGYSIPDWTPRPGASGLAVLDNNVRVISVSFHDDWCTFPPSTF